MRRAVDFGFIAACFIALWFASLWWLMDSAQTIDFVWPKWTAISVVAVLMMARALVSNASWDADHIDLLSFGFVAWCSLSVLWTPDFYAGVYALEHVAMLWLVFSAGRRVDIESWLPWFVVAVLAGMLLYTKHAEFLWGAFGNPNDMAQAISIMLPFLLWPTTNRWTKYFLISVGCAALAWLLAYSPSRMGWIALAAALVALLWHFNKRNRGYYVALIPVAALVAWFIAPEQIGRSLLPRVQIWVATLEMIFHHPLIGVGLNGFEPSYPDFAAADLRWWPSIHQEFLDIPNQRPGASHNDWLQIASEGGLIGFGLAAATTLAAMRSARMGGASIAVWIAVCLASADFPLQKPGSALIAVLALAVLTRIRHNGYGATVRALD